MLVELERDLAFVAFSHLGYVYETVLVYAYVDKGSEIGNICHNSRYLHSFRQVLYVMDVFCK